MMAIPVVIVQDINTFQGDSAIVEFRLIDETGTPAPIGGVADILWSAQRTLDTDPVTSKSKTGGDIAFTTDGTDGSFRLTLLGADTTPLSGNYMHQVRLDLGEGALSTAVTGTLRVGRLPSWTYSGDPRTSLKDQTRFLLGDTEAEEPELMDEEILYALSISGTAVGAAAICARALAAKYARLTSVSADGVSQALNQKTQQFRQLAQDLDRKAAIYTAKPFLYGVSKTDIDITASNPDRVPDIFRIGIMDNPPSYPESRQPR